jgi:diguanylate cyclase (GGDEF)-like protein/PAS domain S-box-containing protein
MSTDKQHSTFPVKGSSFPWETLRETTWRLMELLARPVLEHNLLQKSVETLITLFQVRYAALGLTDETGGFTQFLHAGIAAEEARRIGRLPQGKGLLGVAIRENRVLRLKNLKQDPRVSGFPAGHPPMEHLLAAPLAHRGQPFGCLYLSEKTDGSDFSDADENLLAHIAGLFALALAPHFDPSERARTAEAAHPRMMDALRESEKNLRAIAENTGEGILVNLDGKHVFVNRCLEEMLGYQPGELRNTTLQDVVHPDEIPRVMKHAQDRVAGNDKPSHYETTFITKSGGRLPVEISATTTTWQGRPAALVFARDFTERRRAQAQMRQLSSAVEQTADSVVITDREGVIQYVNPAYERMTGFGREEAVGQTPRIVKSGRHPAAFYEHLWKNILDGRVFREVFINRRQDGELYYEEKTITPLKDEKGNITHFVSTGKDISQQIRDKQALEESQQRYRAMTEVSPVGVFRTDAEGRCLYVNERWCAFAGLTPEQAAGTGWSQALHPEDRERVFALWHEMVNEGLAFRAEYRFRRPDGSVTWLFGQSAAERDASGNIVGYVGSVTDITERKRAEKAQRENNEILERIFDSTHFSVVYLDRDFNFIRVNRAYAQACGHPPEYFPGKNHFQLYPHAENEAIFRHVVRTGEPFTITAKPFEFPDHPEWGVTYWDWTLHSLKDAAGNVEALLFVLLDVTERRRGEDVLARLGRIVDSSSNEIYVFGCDDLRFIQVNQGARQNLGYTMEELRALTPLDLKPEFNRESFEALLAPLRRGEQDTLVFTARHRRKDGSLYPIEVRLQLSRTENPPVFFAIIQDITERKITEEALRASEERFRSLTELSSDWYWEQDSDLRFTLVTRNDKTENIFSADETLGKTRWELPYLDASPEFWRAHKALLLAHQPFRELVLKRQDARGNIRFVSVSGVPIFDAHGRFQGYRGTGRDITERMQSLEALRESEASLAKAQRIAHIGNWERNLASDELRWSDETYRIFGLTPQQQRITYTAFLSMIHPDDRQSIIENVNKATNHKQPYGTEYRLIRPDGSERVVRTQAQVESGNDGEPARLVGTIQDITEQRQTQERLNYLAHYDTLTGLPNRLLLQDRLSLAMVEADRRDRLVAVIFLDLDRFKIINDTLGHEMGDALLKSVAERLKACVRAGDTISRLGGDEFTIVLAGIGHVDDVAHVAQKIIESFVSPFHINGRELFVSPSMGITLYPFDDNDIDSLLRNADAAMYHAKELGRNTFQFYTAELNRRTAKRLALETALRHAIERNELQLHYQPQVNLGTGRITGAEALLRWRHPEMGPVSPLEFIPLAEETGLIVQIGEWVLRTACAQARAWHELGFGGLQIAVNLSGRQFQHRHLARLVKNVLRETPLDPRLLDLELTESLLMHNTEAILGTMDELHAHGVAFSMDDFGTGYSSLSYLKRFPIDTLKIDQTFVRDIPRDPDDAAIARAIISMAHSLGMKVIAEGVETAQQLSFLRANRCDSMQGYYFSKPLPADVMTGLLQKNRRLKSAPGTARLRGQGSKSTSGTARLRSRGGKGPKSANSKKRAQRKGR